ncbi:MAG: type III-A CRISPR-associated RAMP protein Csm4 [Atribacterota bacterium]
MTFTVVKLFSRFPLRWHSGLGSLDRSDLFPHSDTLFSALVNAFLLLYGEEMLPEFLSELWVSSVFPGIRQEGKDVLFFPVPLSVIFSTPVSLRKKVKKVRFASWDAFQKLVKTFDFETHAFAVSFSDVSSPFLLWGTQYVITHEEAIWLGRETIKVAKLLEPHVVLDRTNNRSQNLYFEEDIWMVSEPGAQPFLFFLYGDCRFEMTAILRLFVEEGLGGERFQGKGSFDWFEVDTLDIPQNGEYMVLFSVAKPRRSEIDALLAYDLVKRGGFVFRGEPLGFQKRTHYKIAEGSLVRFPFVGENMDVSPFAEQPIISYGKALGYAFSGKGEMVWK